MAISALLLMIDQAEAEEIRDLLTREWNSLRRDTDKAKSDRIEGIIDALDELLEPQTEV